MRAGISASPPKAAATKPAGSVVEAASSPATKLSVPLTMAPKVRGEPAHAAASLSPAEPAVEQPPPAPGTDPIPAPLMPEPPGGNPNAPAHAQTWTSTDETADMIKDPGRAMMFNLPRPIVTGPLPTPPEQISDQVDPQVEPHPLLPQVATRVNTLTPSGTHTTPAETSPAVETETEVHVHIGRIEVTAVQEAAVPKPAAAGRRQPMSLDDYLARRQQNHE